MINEELVLPSGLKLKNRLVKSSMTEGLADEYQNATPELCNLYRTWSTKSGVGMLLTGNIQVDKRFLERPRNVVIDMDYENENQIETLTKYAEAARQNDTKVVAQIGHAGRQASPLVAKQAIAPSSITLTRSAIPVAEAVEATVEQIERVIEKFVSAAKICEECGFDGVEIHSAHGYLLSSFLNPLANKRNDEFGGSLENRVKPLLQIVKSVKEATNAPFCVGVKLNSADFQKGGFTVNEASEVACLLTEAGIDFLEVSGGNYETPLTWTGKTENAGETKPKKTQQREAYFLDFADEIIQSVKEIGDLPILVTGGFRSSKAMNSALEKGSANLIGVGRPLCMDPSCTQQLLDGEIERLPTPENDLALPGLLGWSWLQRFTYFHGMRMGASQTTYYVNLIDMGKGNFDPKKEVNILTNMKTINELEKANSLTLKGYKKDDPYILDHLKQDE